MLIGLNVGLYISAVFAGVFGCTPVEKSWHFWVVGHCINKRNRDLFNASFNLATDVFIFLLPQRVVWGLQVNGSRKFGVSIVFSVGLLYVIIISFLFLLRKQTEF